jgi:hypothetical protein
MPLDFNRPVPKRSFTRRSPSRSRFPRTEILYGLQINRGFEPDEHHRFVERVAVIREGLDQHDQQTAVSKLDVPEGYQWFSDWEIDRISDRIVAGQTYDRWQEKKNVRPQLRVYRRADASMWRFDFYGLDSDEGVTGISYQVSDEQLHDNMSVVYGTLEAGFTLMAREDLKRGHPRRKITIAQG